MFRILRVVGSRLLACGCFVGVYETYSGESIEIVEERGPRCVDRSHQESRPIAPPPVPDRQHTAAG